MPAGQSTARITALAQLTEKAMKTLRTGWPFLAILTGYYLIIYLIIFSGIQATQGQFVYPLDDTYIHMAMAKHFAEQGVWGFTAHAFSSSTSSPLWTALLAGSYALVGTHDMLPLALNILIGTLLIFYLFRLLRQDTDPVNTFILLAIIVSVTSLPSLTIIGMEHVLHTLLTVSFVYRGVQLLMQQQPTFAWLLNLLIITALLTLTRYEGLFAVVTVCLFLCLQRRIRYALLLGVAAITPLAIYGILTASQGWLPVPNSVLLKGHTPAFTSLTSTLDSFGLRALQALSNNLQLAIVLALVLIGFFYRIGQKSVDNSKLLWLASLFVGLLLLHLQFAKTGWLFRYEAYLVALGLLVALPVLSGLQQAITYTPTSLPSRLPVFLLSIGLMALAYPLLQRAITASANTAMAMHDRYLEHIQPTRFVNEYYPQATIMVNDIGAIAYFTDNRILDMYGLGNMEPILFRHSPSGYNKKDVQAWATREQTEIAIFQIEWTEIAPRIPDQWIKVAEWRIPRNVVFGDKRIGFFAVDAVAAATLAQRLQAFAGQMPSDIKVTMLYVTGTN